MSEQVPPEQAPADYRTLLIDARTQSWLTHEEISQATGLRVAYLEALEQGTLESVVSGPYVRSMLVCYGSYLGLDPDLLMRAYEATVASSGPRAGDAPAQTRVLFAGRVAVDKRSKSARGSRRIRRLLWLALGVALGAAVIAVVLLDPLHLDLIARVGTVSLAAGTTESRPPLTTTTSAAGAVVVVSTSTTPSSPTTTSPTTTTLAPVTTTSVSTTTTKPKKHTVRIVPAGEVWLDITSESGGTVLFRGTKKAGEELSFKVLGPLKVTVGRPEMVAVFLNGVAAPLPGSGLWLITATEVRER